MRFLTSLGYLAFLVAASRLLMTADVRLLSFALIGLMPLIYFGYERTKQMELQIAGLAVAVSLAFIIYRHDLHYRGVDPDLIVTTVNGVATRRYSKEWRDRLSAELQAKYQGDDDRAQRDMIDHLVDLKKRRAELTKKIEQRAQKKSSR